MKREFYYHKREGAATICGMRGMERGAGLLCARIYVKQLGYVPSTNSNKGLNHATKSRACFVDVHSGGDSRSREGRFLDRMGNRHSLRGQGS